nr:histidinol-phosphatase HisJ family protein [Fredinandcohnia onubensis]
MFIADYHIHTNNSFDSKSEMNRVCNQAIKNGVKEICITDHFSINPKLKTYGHMRFDKYFSDINFCKEKYKNQLKIRVGLELCEPHLMMEEYKAVLQGLDLDFLLGAVHNIDGKDLKSFIINKTSNEVYSKYFEEVYGLVCKADIDVIAHLDFIKRYAIEQFGTYRFYDYQDILEAILNKAIDRGIGIELNMAGYNNTKLSEAYPNMEILKLYRSLGGEIITIGSDAHIESMVGYKLDVAFQLIKEVGFNYLFTYESRKQKPVEISSVSNKILR